LRIFATFILTPLPRFARREAAQLIVTILRALHASFERHSPFRVGFMLPVQAATQLVFRHLLPNLTCSELHGINEIGVGLLIVCREKFRNMSLHQGELLLGLSKAITGARRSDDHKP